MDEHELDYYEKLADRHQEFLEELEVHKKEFEDRHDPIEDILLNDEDEVGGYCSYTDYLIMEQESSFEIMMGNLAKMIQEENQYGHIMEAADKYYEELEALETASEASPHDPMGKLLVTMKVAEQFGCEMDKSFAYEGLDLISQEAAEDNFGDGDPSQWNY